MTYFTDPHGDVCALTVKQKSENRPIIIAEKTTDLHNHRSLAEITLRNFLCVSRKL